MAAFIAKADKPVAVPISMTIFGLQTTMSPASNL
jgi:hypothetical protein